VRIAIAAGAGLVALLAGVAGAAWLDGDGVTRTGFRISGDEPGLRGAAFLEQDGDRLNGFVVVWGLEPGSAHAVHFHGPDSACGAKADPVAVHPDLRADARGVAYAKVDVTVERDLLDGGFYYNVHEGPSRQAENPEIACGDIAADSSAAAR
jgi:hypothetical protein